MDVISDAEDSDSSGKEDSRRICSNQLGSSGEEIFILKGSNRLSLIVNGDKNEFINRSSESVFDGGESTVDAKVPVWPN